MQIEGFEGTNYVHMFINKNKKQYINICIPNILIYTYTKYNIAYRIIVKKKKRKENNNTRIIGKFSNYILQYYTYNIMIRYTKYSCMYINRTTSI